MGEYPLREKCVDGVCLAAFPLGLLSLAVLAGLGYSDADYGDTYVMITEVVSVLLVMVLPLLRLSKTFRCPYWFMLVITSVVYLHAVSLFAGFYKDFEWWDAVSHSYSSVVVTMIAFVALLVIQHYTREIELGTWTLLLMTFVIGFGFGNVWEIAEWLIDTAFGTPLMSYSLEDTLGDIRNDAAGAFAMTMVARGLLYYRDTDRIVESMNLDRFMKGVGEKWDRRCGRVGP